MSQSVAISYTFFIKVFFLLLNLSLLLLLLAMIDQNYLIIVRIRIGFYDRYILKGSNFKTQVLSGGPDFGIRETEIQRHYRELILAPPPSTPRTRNERFLNFSFRKAHTVQYLMTLRLFVPFYASTVLSSLRAQQSTYSTCSFYFSPTFLVSSIRSSQKKKSSVTSHIFCPYVFSTVHEARDARNTCL